MLYELHKDDYYKFLVVHGCQALITYQSIIIMLWSYDAYKSNAQCHAAQCAE